VSSAEHFRISSDYTGSGISNKRKETL